MAVILKVSKAFRAMKDIGIGEDRTEPVLKKLLKLYEKNWNLIEEENYRVLADAIFDEGDNKGAEEEKKVKNTREADFGEDIQSPDESVRPLKRLRLRGQEAQVSSFLNSTVSGSDETPLIINLEEDGFPETHPLKQVQLCAPKRSENDPSSSRRADNGKESISPNMVARVKKSNMEKPSTALRIKEPAAVSGVKNHKVRSSGAHTLIVLDEPFIDDISTTVLPPCELPAINTGSLPKDEPFIDDISTTILPPYELPIAAIHTCSLPKDEPCTDDISMAVSPPYELPIAAIHTGSLPKDEPFTDDISMAVSPPYELPMAAIHTGSLPKDEPFTDDISMAVSPPYELPAINTGSLPKDEPFTDDISTTVSPPYALSIAAIHPDPSSKGDCAFGNNSVGKPDSEDARASHPLDGSNKVDSTGTTQYKRSTSSELPTVIEESHPNLEIASSPLEEIMMSGRRPPPRSRDDSECSMSASPDSDDEFDQSASELGATQVPGGYQSAKDITTRGPSDSCILQVVRHKLEPHRTVSKRFTEVIQSGPLPSSSQWSKLPYGEKKRLFDRWKRKFIIHQDITDDILFPLWSQHVSTRYRDTLYRARQRDAARRPKWMGEVEHEQLRASMQTKAAQRISAINKANRLSNPSLHTGGSIPHDEHHRRLEQREGRSILPDELHVILHTKKDGTLVDNRARERVARYTESLSQRLPTEDSQPTQEDQVAAFLDAAGGVRRDGSIPGLGSHGRRLYADAPRPSGSNRSTSVEAELQQSNVSLQQHVQQLESRVHEMESTMQEQIQSQISAQVQALVQEQMVAFFRSLAPGGVDASGSTPAPYS